MSEIIISKGVLIWQPFLRIIYNSNGKKNDVLIDSLIPSICNEPLSAVLLARKTNIIKLIDKKPVDMGIELEPATNAENLLELVKEAYRKAEMLEEESRKAFREKREVEIDWQRYRALFIPTRRLIGRKEPIFRYFMGKREAHPYTVALFIKGLIKEGFNMTSNSEADILETKKIYYPLVITPNSEIYEIAWKLSESVTYKWALENFDSVKNFYNGLLLREEA